MKAFHKLAFLLLVAVAFPTSAFTQWVVELEDKDELGVSYRYEHIDCSDEKNCTAAGFGQPQNSYRNFVWRTTDGGENWNRQELPAHPQSLWPIARIKKVHSLDSLNVLIVGDSGIIFRTTDGGLSWKQQDQRQQWSYNDGWLASASVGYAVGNYGKIMRTTDGGENWDTMPSPTPYVIKLVRALSPNRLLVVDMFYGMQYSSSDQGMTWDTLQLFPDYFLSGKGKSIYDAFFWDETNGVLAGLNRITEPARENLFVMRTTDGGKTWRTEYDDGEDPNAYAKTIDFYDRSNGVVATGGQSLYRTSDGGKNWVRDSAKFNPLSLSLCSNSAHW